MDTQKLYDVVIIGSGPAGMTAAVYTSRGGLNTLIIEKDAPGGKMVKTFEIENYPAFEKIAGADLAMKMHTHSLHFGADYAYGDIDGIKKLDKGFEIRAQDGSKYYGKTVIAATGTIERTLGLANEDLLLGKGLSYCAVCDGAFFRDRNVVVIGGGNSALEEALYLTQFASKVTMVIRRDVFRGDQVSVRLVEKNPKIDIIRHHVAVSLNVNENQNLSSVTLENVLTKERFDLKTDGLFPYIGADPATEYLKDLGILNENGFTAVNQVFMTEIEGLYAVGDMVDKNLRQIVTATNDAAIAAQHAFQYLNEKGWIE